VANEIAISARAQSIQPSATLSVSARANELRAQGKKVLNFAAGEPDFAPPEAVRHAVADFVREKPAPYSPVPGMPALREAVAAELSDYHGHPFAKENILISCGGKHSLANLFFVALNPGDEVVIPAPYWVSYPVMVQMNEGVPVVAQTSHGDGWQLRPETLAKVCTPRTRFLLLNYPSNPTGAAYSRELIAELGKVLTERAPQAWIVVDDIYRKLVYGNYRHVSAFEALREITDRIIVVDGVSKAYAMTGYRIGFLAAPKAVVSAASRVQGQTTSGAATPSQVAALAAVSGDGCAKAVEGMRVAFAQRRKLMLEGLGTVPGLATTPPDGAFYVFPDASRHIGPNTRFADDIAFSRWLLDEKLVATVPGTPFGAPGHLRLSYATDDATIAEGTQRIRDAVSELPTARS
jgi:aspartate aminotransferase